MHTWVSTLQLKKCRKQETHSVNQTTNAKNTKIAKRITETVKEQIFHTWGFTKMIFLNKLTNKTQQRPNLPSFSTESSPKKSAEVFTT